MSRNERGVHRGRFNPGNLGVLRDFLTQELGFEPKMNIVGSRSVRRGSSSSRTDTDVDAIRPKGLSDEKLSEIEHQAQDLTGIDFLFVDPE
jgi:hypothetical protein